MKKAISLILAIALVLALSVTAIASAAPSGEPSGEASVEVTNEGFGSYVSYLRKYIASVDDPQFDEGAKEMALGELDSVSVGDDVYAFPFEMFVNSWGAMTYDEYMLSKNTASAEPQTSGEFDAYVAYVRDYMENYDGTGTGEGFDEASRQMALSELDKVSYGSSVNAFPFEMYINEFGVMSYADFAASSEPSGEAGGEASGEDVSAYEGYVAYLDAYIRAVVEADFVEMALSDLYAATEQQAIAGDFPFEMFSGAHGAMSYEQWQAANQ